MKGKVQSLISFLLLISVAGCDIPERPQDVTISKVPVFRPSNPKEINTIDQALDAIVTICRDDIGLPVVDPLHVRLYKNSVSFAFYGHGWWTLPYDVADQEAFARNNEIHIDLKKVGKTPWGTSIRFLAHEYAHTIHNGFPKPKHGTAFIAEGFAEWVTARALHFLRWQDYANTLHQSRLEVGRDWQSLPDIPSLRDNRVWKRTLSQPKGFIRTYTVAFLAMDWLIQHKGLPAVIQYLGGNDPKDNFITWLDEFSVDLSNSLLATIAPRKAPFTIERPDWKIGYKWIYVKKNFGNSTTAVKEIIGEDTYRGTPVFVLRTGDEETLYGKEGLGFVASRTNGKIISDVDKPNPFFSWPLEQGKESRALFTERNLVENSDTKYDRVRFAAGIEQINVAAGKFDAVKIESYERPSGGLWGEYWYSPKVKWFVKTRTYSNVGVTEEELSRVELESAKQRVR